MCSGGLPPGEGRLRLDIRHSVGPDVVADGCALPLADESVAAVMLDPPYTLEYADHLYETEYPRPAHLLAEAARVTQPGGGIAILHFMVPNPPKGTDLEGVYGVTTGCGYRIRAFSLYRRRGVEDLFKCPT